MTNHYKTLQVDPSADQEVLKAAFRALVKLHQNDNRKMLALNEANEAVCEDVAKRRAYDIKLMPKSRCVGEYRLIEKIAEGGFGETWKAEHIELGSPVCLKYALELTPDDEQFLIAEAKLICDLRHYAIPAFKGLLRMPDKKLALVMSYIPGLTLAQYIEKHYPNGMDAEHVAWITERVLNVLKYLHFHGVVHGDVKPQNIIIEAEKHTVVVVDYGLSQVKPKAKTGAKGYTPYFCAPEQEEWQTPIPQTDLYGLGMTMIFALGGDVVHKNVPDNTPPEMLKLIKSFIKRDPLKRPDVWVKDDLCEVIKEVRQKDFGRISSNMKPLAG